MWAITRARATVRTANKIARMPPDFELKVCWNQLCMRDNYCEVIRCYSVWKCFTRNGLYPFNHLMGSRKQFLRYCWLKTS